MMMTMVCLHLIMRPPSPDCKPFDVTDLGPECLGRVAIAELAATDVSMGELITAKS